jgi:hypothetical protein
MLAHQIFTCIRERHPLSLTLDSPCIRGRRALETLSLSAYLFNPHSTSFLLPAPPPPTHRPVAPTPPAAAGTEVRWTLARPHRPTSSHHRRPFPPPPLLPPPTITVAHCHLQSSPWSPTRPWPQPWAYTAWPAAPSLPCLAAPLPPSSRPAAAGPPSTAGGEQSQWATPEHLTSNPNLSPKTCWSVTKAGEEEGAAQPQHVRKATWSVA